MISWIMTLAMVMTTVTAPISVMAAQATDISGHWAEGTIAQWQDAGLISGYEDGSFKPNNEITRAEFVSIMNNALNFSTQATVSFSDVAPSDWFYNAISVAVGEGYTAGFPDNTFNPSGVVTRGQAAVFVNNAVEMQQSATSNFSDKYTFPTWATPAINAMSQNGYISGYPDGTFMAEKSLTRAEAVVILNKVMGNDVPTPPVEVEDVVIKKSGTKLADQTIEGNLIIDKAVGEGKVTLEDVTVNGNLIVEGGGSNSVYLTDTIIKGDTMLNKKGVRLQLSGDTEVGDIRILQAANIVGKTFEGSVGTITIPEEIKNSALVSIGVDAASLEIEGKAKIEVSSEVGTISISKDAEDTSLSITSDGKVEKITVDAESKVVVNGKVETFIANSEVTVTGKGDINDFEANADDISISSSIDVDKIKTDSGIDKPSRPSGGSDGGSNKPRPPRPIQPETPAIDTAKELKDTITAAAASATTTITVEGAFTEAVEATYAGANLTIDFGKHVMGDVTITAPVATNIVLNGAGSLANLTVDAPKATVDQNVNVVGTTTITAVSNTSFNLNANAGKVIMNGEGKLVVAKNSTITNPVEINTAENVIMDGTIEAVAVKVAGAKVAINGTVETVAIEVAATGTTLSGSGKVAAVTTPVSVEMNGVTAEKVTATGTETVTLSGTSKITEVVADAPLVVAAGTAVESVTANKEVTLNESVAKVTVPAAATGVTITVASGKTVATVDTAATVTLAGAGSVTAVEVTADSVTVTVNSTTTTKPTVDAVGDITPPTVDGTNSVGIAVEVKLAAPVVTMSKTTAINKEEGVTFTITNPNATAKDSKIYYTIDGTTPTKESTLYTAEQTITAPVTDEEAVVEVKAIVIDTATPSANKESNIATGTVTYAAAKSAVVTLSGLSVATGTLAPIFSADVIAYTVELPTGTTQAPTVMAKATDANATVKIAQATSTTGKATVIVTAEDGTATQTYTITFSVKVDPTAGAKAELVKITTGNIELVAGATIDVETVKTKLQADITAVTLADGYVATVGGVAIGTDKKSYTANVTVAQTDVTANTATKEIKGTVTVAVAPATDATKELAKITAKIKDIVLPIGSTIIVEAIETQLNKEITALKIDSKYTVTLADTATTATVVGTADGYTTKVTVTATDATTAATDTATGTLSGTVTLSAVETPISITVTPKTATITTLGGTQALAAEVVGTTNTTVTWVSGTPATATVDNKGVVTAVAEGTATITATVAADTAVTATSTITVEIAVTPLTTKTATAAFETAEQKTVKYSVENVIPTATYKVYSDATGTTENSNVQATVTGAILTLTFTTAATATGKYYISTVSGAVESTERLEVTSNLYVPTTLVLATSESNNVDILSTETSVTYTIVAPTNTLPTSITRTYEVYDNASGGTKITGASATINDTILTVIFTAGTADSYFIETVEGTAKSETRLEVKTTLVGAITDATVAIATAPAIGTILANTASATIVADETRFTVGTTAWTGNTASKTAWEATNIPIATVTLTATTGYTFKDVTATTGTAPIDATKMTIKVDVNDATKATLTVTYAALTALTA